MVSFNHLLFYKDTTKGDKILKSRIKYGKVVLYTLLYYFMESNISKGYNIDKNSYGRMVISYGFTLGVIVILLIIAGIALLVVKACDESAKAKRGGVLQRI